MELFRKQLSKTDVNHRLAVPSHALETFQLAPDQYSKRIQATGVYDDFVWRFELAIRREDPNPRPELRGGWKQYVQAKHLTEGDTIVFQVEQNPAGGENIYKIGGVRQKPLRLFGGNHIVYA